MKLRFGTFYFAFGNDFRSRRAVKHPPQIWEIPFKWVLVRQFEFDCWCLKNVFVMLKKLQI